MSTDPLPNRFQRRLLWPGLGVLVLLVWTAGCHVTWLHRTGAIHGWPAFFAGLLVLILGDALVRLILGAVRRGWRWLGSREACRLCGWAALFAISTIALFYNFELWRGQRAWAAVVDEATLRGEPLTFDALIPPPVPDQRNVAKATIFAPLFERKWDNPHFRYDEAEDQLVIIERPGVPYEGWRATTWGWLEQAKTDLHAQAEYYAGKKLPAFAGEAQAATAVLAVLGKYATNLDQLREFSARPDCQFTVPYERQMMAVPWHVIALRDVVNLLARRAAAELSLPDPGAALADAQLALRVVEYSRQQLWAGSSGMRVRLTLAAIQPVWEGLKGRAWTAPQLTDLQKRLEALNVIADYPAQVRMDALFMSAFVESLIPSRKSPVSMDLDMDELDHRALRFVRWIYPVGWSLQDQASIRRFQFQRTETALENRSQPARDRRAARLLFTSSDPFFPVFITPKVVEMAEDAAGGARFGQTVLNQAALACALERYRLDNGTFPETLAALSPRYVGKLPTDLNSGEPLKYRRTAEGQFILYSVGSNGIDDGGKPSPRERASEGRLHDFPSLHKFDWVWAYSVP